MSGRNTMTSGLIRSCEAHEHEAILWIVNAAAEAYRGAIPATCWHEPYMGAEELARELAAGVLFRGYVIAGVLVGVMGLQARGDVDLIRHAYVLPEMQGSGVGRALLESFLREQTRPMLVGTWRAAEWAIRFYERNGFLRATDERVPALLRAYWSVSEVQIANSVVLLRQGVRATLPA